MKDSLKRGKPETKIMKETPDPELDELYEIEMFIRKKQLQNQVLKKLTKEIESSGTQEKKKPASQKGLVS